MPSPSTTRRLFLAASAAGAALASFPVGAAVRRLGSGPLSGLPWYSGCSSGGFAVFEDYRGRKNDSVTMWCEHATWSDIAGLQSQLSKFRSFTGLISTAIPPLPRSYGIQDEPSAYQRAARGDFDGYYRQAASRLAAYGKKNLVVRIGWEVGRKSVPWFAWPDPAGFVATFRRIARIVRETNPTVLIEWSNIKSGTLDIYPGDAHVDIVGVNYYDGWPSMSSEAIFEEQLYRTFRRNGKDGPYGIAAWLEFAKSRGKQLSCSEWGIMVGGSGGGQDSPAYIEGMFEFFSRNAAYIAYENYFHQMDRHRLTPSYLNPRSSLKYKQLWGRTA